MIANIKNYLIGAGVLILLLLFSFIGGCQHGKKIKVCPTIVIGTILKLDTVTHHIYHIWPWYIDGKDSIVYVDVPAVVDTMKILADYYAKHYSTKLWQDSIIDVSLDMMITENKFYPQKFDYKIKRAQAIINNTADNSVHYVSYLYLGGSIPINKFDYSSIDLTLSLPKWYIGGGYIPGQNTFVAKGGIKLLQFKKK